MSESGQRHGQRMVDDLDNDHLRRASEAIAGHIAVALEGNQKLRSF
jgi:hypothetical protein